MRKKMIEDDLVECVIALGKNLFYNSIMESCLLITNNNKSKSRKGKVLFIDAREELKREKTISYLLPEHIDRIYKSFKSFKIEEGFSHIADDAEILKNDSSLNVPLYVENISAEAIVPPQLAFTQWQRSSNELKKSMNQLFEIL
jgi:type I restriction enzyme M protein